MSLWFYIRCLSYLLVSKLNVSMIFIRFVKLSRFSTTKTKSLFRLYPKIEYLKNGGCFHNSRLVFSFLSPFYLRVASTSFWPRNPNEKVMSALFTLSPKSLFHGSVDAASRTTKTTRLMLDTLACTISIEYK